tara:strand:- start:815 stop:1042 length:228 start_codon:yes stop_codon:yes gene_type:complete
MATFLELEQQYAQEEAHRHFVIQEFSHMVLELGPNSVMALMDPEAREEIEIAVQLNTPRDLKDFELFDPNNKETA